MWFFVPERTCRISCAVIVATELTVEVELKVEIVESAFCVVLFKFEFCVCYEFELEVVESVFWCSC